MKADISKKILRYLVLAGMVSIAATSPFFISRLVKAILKDSKYKSKSIEEKRKFNNAFYYLKKRGLITVEKDEYDIKIVPTEKGIRAMKKYQILEMKIEKPKKWDKKLRVVAFDISNKERIKRNAFRRKLKELGFYSSQKSVWVHPFECKNEIKILKDFFGLNNKQIHFFTAEKIEDEFLMGKIRNVYEI